MTVGKSYVMIVGKSYVMIVGKSYIMIVGKSCKLFDNAVTPCMDTLKIL